MDFSHIKWCHIVALFKVAEEVGDGAVAAGFGDIDAFEFGVFCKVGGKLKAQVFYMVQNGGIHMLFEIIAKIVFA